MSIGQMIVLIAGILIAFGVMQRVLDRLKLTDRQALFFALILTIVNSLKIFRESYLLYGYYPDESVYMLQNYLNNHFAKLNYQNIGTAAVLFAVVVYSIVAVLFALEKKWSDSIW